MSMPLIVSGRSSNGQQLPGAPTTYPMTGQASCSNSGRRFCHVLPMWQMFCYIATAFDVSLGMCGLMVNVVSLPESWLMQPQVSALNTTPAFVESS